MSRSAHFLVLFAVALACSSTPPPPPDVVGVDGDDVECDPLDGTADDSNVAATDAPLPLTQWVDPFIGTGGVGWGVGTTYPGAQAPLGMVRVGPDTSQNHAAASFLHCSGYTYTDDTIDGFSHFHLHGAGIADYGGTALMPTIGMSPDKSAPRGHGSHFSHSTESAAPGYYAVTLDDTNIKVELTATTHVGFHRYTFPSGSDATVIVDAGHLLSDDTSVTAGSVTIDPAAQTVSGFAHVKGEYSSAFGGMDLYFFAHFTKPFTTYGTYLDGALTDSSTTQAGDDVGAYLHFDVSSDAVVEAHVGVSFVDVTHAQANLAAEETTFDAARTAADAAWESRLERARISTRGEHDRRVFYTALYHTALMPTVASDVDGSYRGIDGNVHHATFRYFTDFSLWDTYRTLHPLVTLLYPEDAADLAASLVQMGKDAGFLPRWPIGTGESGGMIGDGATIVLADTFVKGITGWDTGAGYALAKTQATTQLPKGGRDDVADWVTLGYIPTDFGGDSASKTLEYASADAALANWAAAAGHADDATTFDARSKGAWRALYDPTSHFLFPKDKAGAMQSVIPTAMGGAYTEGTAWQYDFMVPFDEPGLESTMTRPVLLGRVEQLFTRYACTGKSLAFPNPYYWPSNEPDLISGWMFGLAGDHERAGRWLRWATLANYDEGPAGLPGNDDSGTMSAYYLFASLGFYPIAGSDTYVLGSPLIPHATLAVPNGTITIDAPAASKLSRFPTAITLNGASVTSTIRHADLLGATLHFDMTE
ncbi:MAG TPA: GH92 family glycosyl hydrolase [Polyangiaceae bacterium]|jgi:predicted alpha-1,2-mannosidase